MPSRRYRVLALAMAALAVAAFFVLPLLAARIVRGALEAGGVDDRAAYASGASPWSWRFRDADDIVAGRVFGDGALKVDESGLIIVPKGSGRGEVGFPLSRQADLSRLNLLRLDAIAPEGRFSLVVRPVLDAPLVRADLAGLAKPIRLDQLAWRNTTGQPVPPPVRAAMLRLAFTLPPGSSLSLHGAGLARAGGPLPEAGTPIPNGMTAEGLLRWRDQQRARDPLMTPGVAVMTPGAAAITPSVVVTTPGDVLEEPGNTRGDARVTPDNAPPGTARSTEAAWAGAAVYLVALLGGGVVTRRHRSAPVRWGDLVNAGLTLAGPLAFIAGLGLGPHPSPVLTAMFAGGVAYGLYLTWIRALPRWHWRGGWRMAGWPLLAVPVALGIAAVAGHAPAWPPLSRALLYIGWAFFQQWLLLAVVAGLLARALPRPAAVLLVALAFALLHTPNGLLMQLCFVAELGWAWWYLHQRALLPVALAHAASAVIMQACMAGGILRSLEVSARFFM